MNIFQLECFLSVAELLNFTQAATRLYITQPALSRTIASLEEEMGVKLLIRNTRFTKLTPAGAEFAKTCPSILDTLRKSIAQARDASEGKIGSVSLGFQRDTFEPFTVGIVQEFERQYPFVTLNIKSMGITEMLESLSNGSLDAAVANGHTELKDQRQLILKKRKERVALSPNHPLAAKKSILMEELKDEGFIVISHTASASGYDGVIEKAAAAGFTPNIAARVDYVPSMLMLIACGRGISILNEGLAVETSGLVKFVPLECDDTFDRYLIWDGNSENPCLNYLIEAAKAWLDSSKQGS